MTCIYFIRHAQPNHSWEDDATRPLTGEGAQDSKRIAEVLKGIHFDYAISSPYQRSMDTIRECVDIHNLKLHTDERLRERQKGKCGNDFGMFQKRWSDFDFHEEGGESLRAVQSRNIEALFELLPEHKDENVIIGTHGTALSTILNYFDKSFHCQDFLRIIDYMPYIIRLDFNGISLVSKEELLVIEKEFIGNNRADKNNEISKAVSV